MNSKKAEKQEPTKAKLADMNEDANTKEVSKTSDVAKDQGTVGQMNED